MLKYIKGKRGTVIFNSTMVHADVARLLKPEIGEVEGAGFIKGIDPEKIETVGESISLGVKSRPEDKDDIIRELRGY